MTEEEAQAWLAERGWWDGSVGDRLRHFVALVLDEADRQNLISASSRDHIWARHIVDSAQLLERAGPMSETWVDLGTGAGFPGVVIACLRDAPMALVEVRPLRVAFLRHCIDALGLSHVEVFGGKVENARFEQAASVISARAYAPFDRLLASAHHLSDENTVWVLPKGRNGEKELEIIRRDWQAVFHVEHSITDPESVIVTLTKLARRHNRSSSAPQTRRRSRSNGRKSS